VVLISLRCRVLKSSIGLSEGNLKIRWRGWIKEVTISDFEIDKIILARWFVLIKRIDKRGVRLPIDNLELKEKTMIFELLIEYSKQKNLILEK
jgi:hypothetical protein